MPTIESTPSVAYTGARNPHNKPGLSKIFAGGKDVPRGTLLNGDTTSIGTCGPLNVDGVNVPRETSRRYARSTKAQQSLGALVYSLKGSKDLHALARPCTANIEGLSTTFSA